MLAFDRDGKPAAGAEGELAFWNPGAEQQRHKFTIPADGIWHFPGSVPPRGLVSVRWEEKWTPVCSRSSLDLHYTLRKNATVTCLVVRDEQGQPVKDASVGVDPWNCDEEFVGEVYGPLNHWHSGRFCLSMTDDQGKATVTPGEGVHTFVVTAAGYRPALAGPVRTREGEAVAMPAITLRKQPMGKLNVSFVTPNGAPLKDTEMFMRLEQLDVSSKIRDCRRRYSVNFAKREDDRRQGWRTDSDGKVPEMDIPAGRYKCAACDENGWYWLADDFSVAGEISVGLKLRPAPGGRVTGRALKASGEPVEEAKAFAVAEADFLASPPRIKSSNSDLEADLSPVATKVDKRGLYEFKNLPPGKYVVVVNVKNERFFLVFGIETRNGQTVTAPDAKLPVAPVGRNLAKLKGKVQLPQGMEAAEVRTQLWGENWSHSTKIAGDKEFDFSNEKDPDPRVLVVKGAGCKPYVLDLATAELPPTGLVVKLEKQEYGSLRVHAVNETGEPLANVQIAISPPGKPKALSYKNEVGPDGRELRTAANGTAIIRGLDTGLRGVRAYCEGYFQPRPVETAIEPNAETEVAVTLRKGLTFTGCVELPLGRDMGKTVVAHFERQVTPDKDGRFTFSGLAPGNYEITAWSPGLLAGLCTVKLRDNKPAHEVCLRMFRPHGAALQFGKEYAGCSVCLVLVERTAADKASGQAKAPIDAAAALSSDDQMAWGAQAAIDAAGRAEVDSLLPGKYRAYVILAEPFGSGESGTIATADCFAGEIEAQLLKSVADLYTLPAVEMHPARETSAVNGRLVCDPPDGAKLEDCHWKFVLKLDSPNVYCSFRDFMRCPDEFVQCKHDEPILVGTPPAGFTVRHLPWPGAFGFRKVPPGEYTVLLDSTESENTLEADPDHPGERKPGKTVLAKVTVKAGENVDLGVLNYKLPPEANRPDQTEHPWSQAEPEDLPQTFQP